MTSSTRSALLVGLGTTILIGAGAPLVDVFHKCRQSRARIEAACGPIGSGAPTDCPVPTSEACVWGKSLLPVSIAASVILLGLPAGAAAYGITTRRLRR